jgi:hypothetical protein
VAKTEEISHIIIKQEKSVLHRKFYQHLAQEDRFSIE